MTANPSHIEIIARALITRAGTILLCRNLEHGYFYLPGGHVEPGESAAQACRREIREELGLDARIGACRLIAEQRFEQGGKPRHEINLVFHVEHLTCAGCDPSQDSGAIADYVETRLSSDTAIPDDLEIRSTEGYIGFEWVRIGDLGSVDLRPTFIREWIAEVGVGSELRFLTG